MTEAANDTGGRNRPQGPESAGQRFNLRSGSSIVPREGVAGQALAIVIAIMSFLACLTLGGVVSVSETASRWQLDIAREVTIQIRPAEDAVMREAALQAEKIALGFDGVEAVTELDDRQTARLLEPWLGTGVDISELPVPRILTVSVRAGTTPDFAAMREALAQGAPGAVLDDHRTWVDRLSAMAWTTVAIGLCVLALVLAATVLTVVFATRGAMAGNKDIIEVLHFVGADGSFIAREFQRHFLFLALRGSVAGGAAAAVIFVILGVWSATTLATPEGDQVQALFGSFSIGWSGYLGIAVVVGMVALLAAATSRLTVLLHVGALESYGGRRRPARNRFMAR